MTSYVSAIALLRALWCENGTANADNQRLATVLAQFGFVNKKLNLPSYVLVALEFSMSRHQNIVD